MFLVHFLSFACSADPNCHRRVELSQSVTIRDSTLFGCRLEAANGAALYISHSSVSLDVSSSQFVLCRTSASGGTIYADPCLTTSLTRVSASNCSAGELFGFAAASTASGATVRDTAVAHCECRAGLFVLGRSAGFQTSVTSLNVSMNRAIWRAGISLTGSPDASVLFPTFWRNFGMTMVFFDAPKKAAVECGVFVHNEGPIMNSLGDGLIYTYSNLTITNSLFSENRYDLFIEGSPEGGAEVVFVRCVFDLKYLMTMGSFRVVYTNCLSNTKTEIPECQ